MENYYFRITISVLTLDNIKLNDNQYGELLFSSGTGQNKTMTITMENNYFSSGTRQN